MSGRATHGKKERQWQQHMLRIVIEGCCCGRWCAGQLAAEGRRWLMAVHPLSLSCLREVVQALLRHHLFSYLDNNRLGARYFAEAANTLDDGYVYLVFSNSKSAASALIGLFTKRPYNHVSLAFDRSLDTLVSYNGGSSTQMPGLNRECVSRLMAQPGATLLIYRLKANRHQKQLMLEWLRVIDREGSAYNLLGLIIKHTPRPNIMFCSEFVYTMLALASLSYFEKEPAHVRPTDFIELDYGRRLDFVAVRQTE